MRNFFTRLMYKLQAFMQGRYGRDELNTFLYALGFVLLIINAFFRRWYFAVPAMVFIVLCLMRMLSKNHAQRAKELATYRRIAAKPKAAFHNLKLRWRDRKTHKYFRCRCKKLLRVPKGRGKIEITCPACHETLIRKT